MANEHNAFDLAKFIEDNNIGPMQSFATDIDYSGKPRPSGVSVQLNSGVMVKCDIRYAGINPKDGCRLFVVIAEIDWENYFPKVIIVEEMPRDAELRFRVPGMTDAEAQRLCAATQFVAQRIIEV
jgi:hypothetical protein